MSPEPSGKLVATAEGRDLVIERRLAVAIEEAWAAVTEPERTERWFAAWSGEAAPGATIRYRMVFEQGEPEAEMEIEACEAPRHLAVRSVDEHGTWRLELRLEEEGGETRLALIHHLDESAQPGSVGPGWEYYLDLLVAAIDGTPQPSFDDYFPAQRGYYEALESARSSADSPGS
jgi:uncharacterized protein YndB with AHSA1/START domain